MIPPVQSLVKYDVRVPPLHTTPTPLGSSQHRPWRGPAVFGFRAGVAASPLGLTRCVSDLATNGCSPAEWACCGCRCLGRSTDSDFATCGVWYAVGGW
jgi:hypothetical protein